MKYATHPMRKRRQLIDGILERIALVDDAVQVLFRRNFEVLPKEIGLLRFITRILLRSGPTAFFSARQAMIIEAGFAQGDHTRMSPQVAKQGADIIGSLER